MNLIARNQIGYNYSVVNTHEQPTPLTITTLRESIATIATTVSA